MKYIFKISLFILVMIAISGCSKQMSIDEKSSVSVESEILRLYNKTLGQTTEGEGKRIYDDILSGRVEKEFGKDALSYLVGEQKFPKILDTYKANMVSNNETPNDTGGDYMAGYIFAYAGIQPKDCASYVKAFSGTLSGYRILHGCIDVGMFFSTLENKSQVIFDEAKNANLVKVNTGVLESIISGDIKSCVFCRIMILGEERETSFQSILEDSAKFKDRLINLRFLKNYNTLGLFEDVINPSMRESYDLWYDHTFLYHAIYINDKTACKKIINKQIRDNCNDHISKNKRFQKEYQEYINPYMLYSYIYGL